MGRLGGCWQADSTKYIVASFVGGTALCGAVFYGSWLYTKHKMKVPAPPGLPATPANGDPLAAQCQSASPAESKSKSKGESAPDEHQRLAIEARA